MSNMGYCRFENTLSSLCDCLEHLDDKLEDESELKARNKLIKLCRKIGENADAESCIIANFHKS